MVQDICASLLLQMSDEERQKLLSFVICGGGPTGIEVAAEIHDLVFEDLKVCCPCVLAASCSLHHHGRADLMMHSYQGEHTYIEAFLPAQKR